MTAAGAYGRMNCTRRELTDESTADGYTSSRMKRSRRRVTELGVVLLSSSSTGSAQQLLLLLDQRTARYDEEVRASSQMQSQLEAVAVHLLEVVGRAHCLQRAIAHDADAVGESVGLFHLWTTEQAREDQ